MTTKARLRARTHRRAAVSASIVLHAALLAAAAGWPAGTIADARCAPAPDHPARLTWTPRCDVPDTVVVTAPVAETTRVPALPAERVLAAALEYAPLGAERRAEETVASEPRSVPSTPTFTQSRRLHDLASFRPGRGGPAAGPGAGGGIGVGGTGGPGGSTGSGEGDGAGGTAAFGAVRGNGSAASGGDGTGRGGVTRGPSIVGVLPSPDYPAKARARGWEGRVVLLVAIDAHGRVVAADVAESSGRAALDDAARRAAPDWTFAPALRDGVPVAGSLRVPVRFALTD